MCNKKYIFPSLSFNDAHAIRVIAHMYSSLGRSTRRDHPFPPLQLGMAQTCCSGLFGEGWRIALMPLAALRKLFFHVSISFSALLCTFQKVVKNYLFPFSRASRRLSAVGLLFSPSSILSQDNYCHSFIAFKRAFVDVLSCLRCVWRYMMPIAWINILTFCLQLVHLQTRF